MRWLLWLLVSLLFSCCLINEAHGEQQYTLSSTAQTFVIGAALQIASYEAFHKGFRFDKFDATLMSAVLVGTGLTMYQMMEVPDNSSQGGIILRKSLPGWAGMVVGAGICITIPGM
jgi:hypothetical protein